MSYLPDLKSEAVRSFFGGINGKTAVGTLIYIVPPGYKFILTKVIIRVLAANAITVGPTITFGGNNPNYDDYQSALVTNLTAPDTYITFHDSSVVPVYAAGTNLALYVTVGATGTSQTLGCGVVGILMPS